MTRVPKIAGVLMLFCGVVLAFGLVRGTVARKGPYLGETPPGDRPQRFAPDVFPAPPGLHSAPVFSPDGTLLLWSPMSRVGETRMMRMLDDVWSEAEVVDFGMGQGVGEPFFAPDGRRLFFLCFKAPAGDSIERERIWYVDRDGGQWGAPRLIDETVASHPTHWQFSVARNHNLYFTSEAPGTRGGQDIYMAKYKDERYLTPQGLGPNINSDGLDLCPFIAPDESYLLFARKGSTTRKSDLYVSFRDEVIGWTPAVPLGDHVNTDGHDLCPVVSPDGKYLFYTSPVKGGYGVWWVDASFIPALQTRQEP